jgi:hypothetical protein
LSAASSRSEKSSSRSSQSPSNENVKIGMLNWLKVHKST